GSSADIHSGTMRWRDRYSSHGVYASTRGNRKEALLVLGFNGRYKHSAGFNRVRREYASEITGRKITKISQARKIVSVGGTMARLRTVNQDRVARGLKPIRKTAAMGAQGIRDGKFVLARGKDNLAYADIVQRGVFKGIRARTGLLINPRGISAGR